MTKEITSSGILAHSIVTYDTFVYYDTGVRYVLPDGTTNAILDHEFISETGVNLSNCHPDPSWHLVSDSGPVNFFELNRYFVAISDRFPEGHPFAGKRIPYCDKLYFGGNEILLASGYFEYDDIDKKTTVVSNAGTYVFCDPAESTQENADFEEYLVDDDGPVVEDPASADNNDECPVEAETTSFEKQLESLINRYSQENGSNTPDFILASYLKDSLKVFDNHVRWREVWYGRITPDDAE